MTDAKGKTATFATSITILAGMLTIAVTSSPATVAPGGTLTYTITATNSGQITLTGATFTDALTDVLDDASYNNDASATAGSAVFSSPNLTWTGDLAVGASATITFSVTVKNPDTGNKILVETVTSATAGSNCPAGSTDARCTSTVAVLTPGLEIAQSAGAGTTAPGSVVTYTVTVTNSGQTPYTGAAFTDTGNKLLASTLSTAAAGSNCPSGSTDPHCSVSVTVLIPSLTIVKTADVSTTSPGGVVHYTVTVTNSGQTPYAGATYTDQMDGVLADATYNGDAAATAGSVSFASPDMTWTGDLAAGASATVTYSVTVNNPDTGDRILTNTVVSATPGNNCPVGGTDSRCTVTVHDLVPGLDIVTRADQATATPGTVVHYTITVTDTRQTAYTGASFTEPLAGVLDDAAYNGDGAANAGSVSFASPNLTWTGNLAVGAVATITFSVTVNNPDTEDKSMSSTVTSATVGNNCPASGGTDPNCGVTVTVVNATTLTFTATAGTATAAAGGVVHYTITVANSGLTAYNGATFTAGLGGVLDDASYDNDAAATAGTATFTSPSPSWTGDVPASGTVTITYSVTINSPDTGDRILASTITSASADSNCGAGSADPRCTATVNVAALSITTSADVSTTSPGSDVHFTITATNTGQALYSGTSVTLHYADIVEEATYNGDLAVTSGVITTDNATQTATWTGDLAPGATVTITGSVTVIPPDSDLNDKTLTLTVDSAALGNNCPVGGTDPACSAAVAVLVPALTITKTANTTAALPGATVTYTITVADTGDTPYTGATVTDTLTGVLGDAAYDNDAAAASGTLSYASPDLTWTGNLAVGGTVTITYSVTVRNPDTGGKLMVNTVSSATTGSTCPPGTTDPGCVLTLPVLTPALTITHTASPATAAPGQQVTYTITVTDTGQTPYSGAVVTDDLTGLLDDAAYNGDAAASAGSFSYTSPDLTWAGDLAPGQAAIITYTVAVDNPDTGDKTITSTLTSTAPGSTCPPSGPAPACTSTVTVLIPALTLTKTAATTTTTPGSTVGYTVTVTDTGPTPYTAAIVTDSLDGVLDDATYNNDATVTSGTVSYASPDLTWTGDLAPGQAVTITYTLTVNNPDTGDKRLVNFVTSTDAGSTCPSDSPSPACTATVTDLIPALTVTKTATAAAAVPGSTVGYTITVDDTGQTSYDAATVTDALGGVLGDAAYDNDAASTSGTVSYSSPTLTWTGSLAPGDSATITYSVTVNNPDTGGGAMSNAVVSAAPGSTCPAGAPSPGCAVTVAVVVGPLSIAAPAAASLGSAVPGGTVSAGLGSVQVTDDRGFGAGWTNPGTRDAAQRQPAARGKRH